MKRVKDIAKNRHLKVLLSILVDIGLFILVSFLAINLRFDFQGVPVKYIKNIHDFLWLDIFIMVFIFALFNLYNSMWKYASVNEFLNIIIASGIAEAIYITYKTILNAGMPKGFYIIQMILLVYTIGLFRFSYRVARSIITKVETNGKSKRTLIVGAGEAGRLVADEIMRNQRDFNTKIVGFIDDDKNKKGTFIKGVRVYGDRKKIKEVAEKYGVDEIIIAMLRVPKSEIAKIVEECQKIKCEIKILPSIFAEINKTKKDKNVIKAIRPLSYEDFLGRDEIHVDNKKIYRDIKGKTILVTGGGGSIGSELVRQIAEHNPKKLIILDNYENNAYGIQQELVRNYPKLDLSVIIASVRDHDRLQEIFNKFKPDQVFHAAAHKHVPLMEASPNEAIKNNCLGTLNTCKVAKENRVKKFVLISSDKAVRPANIMGATKRICEMIIQAYDKISPSTDFVAVRFGNVLGSNGSVIPLFLEQIDKGGPVTVTHRKMRRFFMTIPEAVSLVLMASTAAKGGEIFVLDMGKPVYIYDLAEKIIRYRGLEPGKDIEIKVTGLRPGEKLYEEILMDEEGLKKTQNELIHIGRPLEIPNSFLDDLDGLIKKAYENRGDIKEQVSKIVTTYVVDKETRDK